MFASVDQMKFYKTSRRDDLISLFYLIIHLLNNNSFVCKNDEMKFLKNLGSSRTKLISINQQFVMVRKYKEKYQLSDLASLIVGKMDVFAKASLHVRQNLVKGHVHISPVLSKIVKHNKRVVARCRGLDVQSIHTYVFDVFCLRVYTPNNVLKQPKTKHRCRPVVFWLNVHFNWFANLIRVAHLSPFLNDARAAEHLFVVPFDLILFFDVDVGGFEA